MRSISSFSLRNAKIFLLGLFIQLFPFCFSLPAHAEICPESVMYGGKGYQINRDMFDNEGLEGFQYLHNNKLSDAVIEKFRSYCEPYENFQFSSANPACQKAVKDCTDRITAIAMLNIMGQCTPYAQCENYPDELREMKAIWICSLDELTAILTKDFLPNDSPFVQNVSKACGPIRNQDQPLQNYRINPPNSSR